MRGEPRLGQYSYGPLGGRVFGLQRERLGLPNGLLEKIHRTACLKQVLQVQAERQMAGAQGTLEFPPGVTERFIEIEILAKRMEEIADKFLLILDEAEGAKFDTQEGGNRDSHTQTIMIGVNEADEGASKWLDATFNCDEVSLGLTEWRVQFMEAIFCGGTWESQKEASCLDRVFHFVSLPWKLFFWPVPPKVFVGGWVCFIVSLAYIAFLTAVIGDMAEIFGCVLEIPDLVTGISFVALGTSMPDLFASRHAAVEDPTADAAIINVTGSNSVNVFLGLGLPWTAAAVVWMVRGQTEQWKALYPDIAARASMRNAGGALVVRGAEDLFFSVIVFAVMAAFALIVVLVRRRYVGGELGGPMPSKVMGGLSLLVFWFSYIGLVSWYSITGKNSNIEELLLVVLGVAALCVSITTCTTLVTMRFKGLHEEEEEEDDAGFIDEIRSPKNNGLSPGGPNSKVTSAADVAVTTNLDDLVLPGPKLVQQSVPPTTTAVHVERLLFTEKSVEIEVASEARQAARLKPAPGEEPTNAAMSLECAGSTWRPAEEDVAWQLEGQANSFVSRKTAVHGGYLGCLPSLSGTQGLYWDYGYGLLEENPCSLAAASAGPVVNFFPSGCRAACCTVTPEDQPRQAWGCAALRNLTEEGGADFRQKALEHGALELVLEALERHQAVAQVQAWGGLEGCCTYDEVMRIN
eukprot:s17_g45.t1